MSGKYLQKKSLGTVWYRQKISVGEVECARRGRVARSKGGHKNWQLIMVVVVGAVVVVIDVVVVDEVLVVVVVPGFFSVGTQSSLRWISSGCAGPNWLFVNVCTIPNPEFFVL